VDLTLVKVLARIWTLAQDPRVRIQIMEDLGPLITALTLALISNPAPGQELLLQVAGGRESLAKKPLGLKVNIETPQSCS